MDQIVQTTHTIFDVDGAGLMLADADHHLRNVAVSDDRMAHLEELQIQHREGPCVAAFEDKELIGAEDLTEEARLGKLDPVIGRDDEIRRTIQVPLFLSEKESFKQRVLQGMSAATGRTPEEAAKSILLGNVTEVKQQVAGFRDAGVEEMYLALWPRFIREPVIHFAREIIPEFA